MQCKVNLCVSRIFTQFLPFCKNLPPFLFTGIILIDFRSMQYSLSLSKPIKTFFVNWTTFKETNAILSLKFPQVLFFFGLSFSLRQFSLMWSESKRGWNFSKSESQLSAFSPCEVKRSASSAQILMTFICKQIDFVDEDILFIRSSVWFYFNL